MNSPRYEILIHRLIDDEITPEERIELDGLLAESSDARAFYESMNALARRGREDAPVPAPAEIRSEVMQRIDHARYRAGDARERLSLGDFIRSFLTARLAYGLAAGLILGIAIGSVAMRHEDGRLASIMPGEVSGTVGLPAASGRVQRVANRSFGLNGATGRLSADQFGTHGTIRVQIDSDVESVITLEFDPALATVQTFEQQTDGLVGATLENGRLTLTHVGDNSYTAMFRLGDEPLTVSCRVSIGGQAFQDRVNFTPVAE